MARGRRTVSRMEKSVSSGYASGVDVANAQVIAIQLDGGEVEAQVKRIMLSFGETGSKTGAFKLGLFQFSPSEADFGNDEAVVISGAIGNQFAHNETITMRVPKDWYLGLLIYQLDAVGTSNLTYSLS